MNKKIFFYNNACIGRMMDNDLILQYFKKNGWTQANDLQGADLILFSTCAYSSYKSKESIDLLRKLIKYKNKMIVTGCLPNIDKKKYKEIFNYPFLSPSNLSKIDSFFPEHKTKFDEIKSSNKILTINKYQDKVKSRFFIRVCRGCTGTCTYCAIPKAIGSIKSKFKEEIISEFQKGLDNNYKDFYFIADDLGSYGLDIGTNFGELMKEISTLQPNDFQIRFNSLHPAHLVKYFDQLKPLFEKKQIAHLICSIQSGNKRILQKMNRYSNLEKMAETFTELLKIAPNLDLATNCIVGFPSESFDEFNDTIKFIIQANFTSGRLIPFSSREGTLAAKMTDKVSSQEIEKRLNFANKKLEEFGYKCDYHDNRLAFFKNNYT
ncbi:radical SAM protein [Candidatus Harpocratesius sp.]